MNCMYWCHCWGSTPVAPCVLARHRLARHHTLCPCCITGPGSWPCGAWLGLRSRRLPFHESSAAELGVVPACLQSSALLIPSSSRRTLLWALPGAGDLDCLVRRDFSVLLSWATASAASGAKSTSASSPIIRAVPRRKPSPSPPRSFPKPAEAGVSRQHGASDGWGPHGWWPARHQGCRLVAETCEAASFLACGPTMILNSFGDPQARRRDQDWRRGRPARWAPLFFEGVPPCSGWEGGGVTS